MPSFSSNCSFCIIPCSVCCFSWQIYIGGTTNSHKTESELGCLEISCANAINLKLFNSVSGRYFWTRTESNHIIYQNITIMLSRPYTNIILPLNLHLNCLSAFLIPSPKVHDTPTRGMSCLSQKYPSLC